MILPLLAATILAQQSMPPGSVVLELFEGEDVIGTVDFGYRLDQAGNRFSVVLTNVDTDEEHFSMRETYRHDKSGKLIQSQRRTNIDGKVASIAVTYGGTELTVERNWGDEIETNTVVYADPPQSLVDPSVFWFVRDTPKRGERIKSWTYQPISGQWVERVVTYHGQVDVKHHEETIKAHRVTVGDEVTMYLDDKGMPWRVTERRNKRSIKLVRKQ